MEPREFEGQTQILEPPGDWDNSTETNKCGKLPIARVIFDSMPRMLSIWKPTDEELVQLNSGMSVRLSIIGVTHPPVWLDVVDAELLA